jgi:curved DNA-binding protein CbpA
MIHDYYKILEVTRSASLPVIKAAYKALLNKYHPDKNIDDSNNKLYNQKLLLIREAYDILSDAEKRKEYDKTICNAGDHEEKIQKTEVVKNIEPTKPSISGMPKNSETSFTWVGIGLIIFVIILVAISAGSNEETSAYNNQAAVSYTEKSQPLAIPELPKEPTEEELRLKKEKEELSLKARIIASFAKDVSVIMPPDEDGDSICIPGNQFAVCNYKIVIPRISLLVYEDNKEAVIDNILKNKSLIIHHIKRELSDDLYTNYTGLNGEEELSLFIKNIVNEFVAKGACENYYGCTAGVEEVLLELSFEIVDKRLK